ncbi:helix-turn-helix transcriptional regulator [Enterococcus thailandicus]|uniref:helix-turn-helix domain-containing protein n=1 Tax=Enterococcus thailandicus TaxID=417368 RepID=UPI00288DAEB9|nr:helix-turn-helix transcriptional regulator [Enterococcus thailandicus]MDT2752305.1 helix-turn-helix transcriptional regulator [Enterococcus thailandicus]MDT2776798.1 helix-turn-helix transcriptional regulator [Enterococcus thailandicus]
MNLLERIKKLAKQKDISIYQLEEEIDIGRNTIYQWNKRTPSADKLQKVADYFNVSTDYLLGRTDNPYAGISPEQREMTIEEALNSVMSYDGKPVTENDREILKRIAEAYLDGHLK